MKAVGIADFRGGYATDVPSELLGDNELLSGLNCYWEDGLRKRGGIATYATNSWATGIAVLGYHRMWIPTLSAWHTILAFASTTGGVFFGHSTSTGVTEITATALASGCTVEMDSMGDHLIAVNGSDKPKVIYVTGTIWTVENLEAFDTKTRATTNWAAGYYDDSGASTALKFVDDTTDMKDAGAGDADLNEAVQYDGIWIACDYTFNRVRLYGTTALASDLVAQYLYYMGPDATASWGQVSTLTGLTLDASATSHTVEFNYPTSWVPCTSTFPSNIQNRYLLKINFDTQPSATAVLSYVDVAHTQYLTQIFDDERPRTVRVHKNHFFLGFQNTLNHSPYHQASGWRAGDVYYFEEGGRRIEALRSHGEYLAVVKDGGIHGIFGNSFANFYQKYLGSGGTCARRSVVELRGALFMADVDGIYRWDGQDRKKISKHIQSDYDSLTVSNVAAVAYKGQVYMSFPSNSTAIVFDPDTYRTDDLGDGRVSMWKFDNYRAELFCHQNGAGDNGYLIAAANFGPPRLLQCNTGSFDQISSTAGIAMRAKTKYYSFGNFLEFKHFGRLKPRLYMEPAAGVTYTATIFAEDGTASVVTTMTVATGTGWWSTDLAVPYTIDGNTIGLQVEHSGITGARFGGFGLSYETRRY